MVSDFAGERQPLSFSKALRRRHLADRAATGLDFYQRHSSKAASALQWVILSTGKTKQI
jgi:hypothetical protein